MRSQRIETLVIIHQPPRVLLGMKKRGRIGVGNYNGFGGGVEDGETIEECAIRETYDEAKIKIKDLVKVGEIHFNFEDPNIPDRHVHFFKASEFEGTPVESDEMRPQWFHIDEIPYDKMWDDDKYWMPYFLEGKKFKGEVYFDLEHKIKDHTIKEVDKLEE